MALNISLILEIVAAALLAIHFLLKKQTHSRIDAWLLCRLKRKVTPRGKLRRGIVVIVSTLTFLILIGIVIGGFITDYGKNTFQTNELVFSYVLTILAIFSGMLICILVILLTNKFGGFTTDPIYVLIVFSLVVSFMIVFLLGALSLVSVNINLASFLVTFCVTILIMSIWFAIIPVAQKYLSFKSGVLVRFGLVVFLVAKIIQLVN